jgi:hypothetical protein
MAENTVFLPLAEGRKDPGFKMTLKRTFNFQLMTGL